MKGFEGRYKGTFYYRLSDAGRLAAARLMEDGHRKIACIINRGEQAILEGYKQAMFEQNLTIFPAWVYKGLSLENIEQYGIMQCLSGDTTAVICGSQEIACCVWKRYDVANLYDVVAFCAIVNPDVLQMKKYYVDVETEGTITRGMTVADFHGVCPEHEKNITCAEGVNVGGYFSWRKYHLYLSILAVYIL